ncbi:putative NBD/HSP70 family sugar kinase [Rhodobacter aestuarii]|uniref:Sugar kinase of the NBD/HSP70 family, may contain an N-terminal HTH domain n=1 Tax=Rhodobacter aestuarii TaxID=453582 RepID=A0A1N7QDD0_9RHOB|nr:ROK family transcriptional regulator [Rhodobacter aestuarii]PTV93587.1 putative NBD/HSP70 family sugar kinase [Rhodobacter aestuarii]SIT20891.1 Sugar kinase of the NBD/HSP70 family, may contain an N-terminal HTH domain [Rhodobacter aestuarii]
MQGSAKEETGRESAAPANKIGTDHSAMRARNERLVLSLIRRHGALAKSEIARLTGLSAQTVSVIMRALEAGGFLKRESPVRGKVGQPTVPMSLAPDGALFLGLKVGRRRTEMVLIDFLGEVRASTVMRHDYPSPDGVLLFARESIAELTEPLPASLKSRIQGLGIGLPFQLWDWAERLGLPAGAMDDWRQRDIGTELGANLPWPVLLENDASAACNAELIFGKDKLPRDFVYAFLGFFVGGGLVLGGSMFAGHSGNAGALASMPVPDGAGGSRQLVELASLCALEQALVERGRDGAFLWESAPEWELEEEIVGPWIAQAAKALAHVAASAGGLCDLQAMVIDGWLPEALRSRLIAAIEEELEKIDLSGMTPPKILAGTAGPLARALGAASLPLSAKFLVEFGGLPDAPARDQ